MLETEEVDDDFFTPMASTSLANIFNKTVKSEEVQNESLKYTAPKPQTIADTKPLPKATDCVFACALFAYQWMNKSYQSRGKIGFAVMRSNKDNVHSIVLYDSKKQTLSTTKITPELNVTVKEDSYLQFYDSLRRYWNVYSTQGEILKIVNLLISLDVNIKNINNVDSVLPESQAEKDSIEHPTTEQPAEVTEKGKESDTDSTCNKKTKASILNRMATMGQSVLPRDTTSQLKQSDYSDTNDETDDDNGSSASHRPSKSNSKKSSHESIPAYEKQLVPLHNKSVDHELAHDTDLKLFITEQRINNTEVRVNINRLSDRLDRIFEKSNNTNNSNNTSTFQMEIYQKLITEYENKIKVYEQLLKPKTVEAAVLPIDQSQQDEKDRTIAELCKQITHYSEQVEQKDAKNKLLLEEIKTLQKQLKDKEEDIEIEKNKLDVVADVIKTVMNETFVQIVEKFKSGESYSSEFIKSTIAEVIKKSTIHCLSEQK